MKGGQLCCRSDATGCSQNAAEAERVRHGNVVRGGFARVFSGWWRGRSRKDIGRKKASAVDGGRVFQRETNPAGLMAGRAMVLRSEL